MWRRHDYDGNGIGGSSTARDGCISDDFAES